MRTNGPLYWIKSLELQKHPEGGYFKETYRNKNIWGKHSDNKLSGEERNLATSIYYLLDYTDVSCFHKLESDELWYFHDGSSLTLPMFMPDGSYQEAVLGKNIEGGHSMQIIIPAGTIFGAYVNQPGTFVLMGCMVTPGFDFKDFTLIQRDQLLRKFPDKRELIIKLTKA